MAHFEVTHSDFLDTRTSSVSKANSLIVNGAERAADLIKRLTFNGAVDAKAVELTAAQHRAIVLARLPQLSGK